MLERHFRRIELPISIEEFHHLPRNSAYKYEYFDGQAVLTPRPKTFNAVRDLSEIECSREYSVQPLLRGDIANLAMLCRAAFSRVQPIGSLDDETALKTVEEWLHRTATDQEGPLIESACFTATTREDTSPSGAILITLAHPSAATDPWGGEWKVAPPPDAIEKRLGIPHLCWIFVAPFESRRGIGTALLAASVRQLRNLGFDRLASTFLLGNDSSTIWHWRHAFKLIPWSEAFKDLK